MGGSYAYTKSSAKRKSCTLHLNCLGVYVVEIWCSCMGGIITDDDRNGKEYWREANYISVEVV